MAWFPIAAQVVGTLMQFSGAMQQSKAAKVAGQQAAINADYMARQQEQDAGQQVAAAQREAAEERRKAEIMASRAMAVAGASGAGVSDPTIINLIADLQGEGSYRSSLAMYQGEDRARQLRQGADTSRFQGRIGQADANYRASAYRTKAIGGLLSGGSSLYRRFAGNGPDYDGAGPNSASLDDRYRDTRFS